MRGRGAVLKMWIVHLKKVAIAAACIAVATTLASGASPASAVSVQSYQTATERPAVYSGQDDPVTYLNPVTIAACNVGLGETVISTYVSRTLGSVDLKCGDGNSGYVHIRQRHQNDWQQVVNIAGGGGNWDDLMEFVTKQSIQASSAGYPRNIGDTKECYSTPTLILSSSGVTVGVLRRR